MKDMKFWLKTHTKKIVVTSIFVVAAWYFYIYIFPYLIAVYLAFSIPTKGFGPIDTYLATMQSNKEDARINKIVPYSQRKLPLPETDVPVILPPDPGEAGKATLAGIDSNNDGVRDDLEREIVYMYPKNEEVRRVLRAMVKKGQEMITSEGDHDHFMNLIRDYYAFDTCHSSMIFPIGTKYDSTNSEIILHMLHNTPERKQKFDENFAKATPFNGTGISFSLQDCEIPEVKGKY